MIHPMIIHTDEATNNLVLKDEKLQKLIDKPRPILWNRAGMYRWVPIERIQNAVRYHKDIQKSVPTHNGTIIFTLGDTILIPQEAGAVIDKYNGHED